MPDEKKPSEVKLRRVLSLSDLIIYGIILIQPVAALPLFGHANNISKGHATTTILNLKGIKVASRTNWILMIVMSVVVFYFMASAIRYIFIKNGFGGLFSTLPFYNPDSFSLSAIGSATALAALTYIGFDGLTTLSEEVKNPKRNVMLAAVLTCLITGVWSGAQIYLAIQTKGFRKSSSTIMIDFS